jgi:protocatechuate 3,4-dioxygenase beta subunit
VQEALDAALGELPETYRAALVLCYLEDRTQEEAARHLGCPLATLRTRLARGRKVLRDRLAKRGLTLSTAGLAALLIASAAPAAAPAALAGATVRAARPFAAGQPAAVLCSRQAAGLVEGGLRTMFLTRVKSATALLLVASLVAGAAALGQRLPAADKNASAKKPPVQAAQAAEAAKPPAADEKDSLVYGGRVLGPDGRPFAGAEIFLIPPWVYIDRPAPSPVYATSGPDGRFQFKAPRAKFAIYQETTLVVTATGHGAGWLDVDLRAKKDDLTLRLVKDVPVAGQVVDLEGRPIQGVTVRVLRIRAAQGDDLRPWLAALKNKEGRSLLLEQQHIRRQLMSAEVPRLPQKTVTDAGGRFRLAGIGRDRLVTVRVSGPTIATQDLHILTRPGQPIEVPRSTYLDGSPASVRTYYGASFRHVATPTRPIVGVVRDRDTKKPLAGITIQSYKQANDPLHGRNLARTTTDAQGRYRLTGMPKGRGNKLLAIPGDQPYPRSARDVPDSAGLEPVRVDFELKRGVWIEGKITDKVTGKPLQAQVEYFALLANPNLRDYAGFEGALNGLSTLNVKSDGTYRVLGLPGPGLLTVQLSDQYLLALERDDQEGARELYISTAPAVVQVIGCNAIARIDPPRDAARLRRDVTLDPGWTFTGTLLGPDGKPLGGVRSFGLSGWDGWERDAMKTPEFTVRAFNPRRPRDVLFQHREKGLVGVMQPPKENGGSVTVRMEPGASVTGRLVDADGQPRPGVELKVGFRPKLPRERRSAYGYVLGSIKTDRQGRFRMDALLPGYEFSLSDGKGELRCDGTLRPGQTRDLGDVQIKRVEE